MKRIATILFVTLTATSNSVVQADPGEYGIQAVGASISTPQAGDHPDFKVSLQLKKEAGKEELPSTTRDLTFDLPPGLLFNPAAVRECTAAQLIGTDVENPSNETGCPQASQVGIAEVQLFKNGELLTPILEPIFNLEPRFGEPVRLGFIADILPVFVDSELQPEREYAGSGTVTGASALVPLLSATTTLWGVPASAIHDAQRITAYEAVHNNGSPETPNGKRPANLVPVPFSLNPTRCGINQGVKVTATPYALPDLHLEAFAGLPVNSGCEMLDFEPTMSVVPTTTHAETGSGLEIGLTFPQKGLSQPDLLGSAAQKRVELTLPAGVTVNPSQAEGLGVCSEDDLRRETAESGPNVGCPETSKIGSVVATSPLIDEPAEGALFVAKPYDNRFGTLLAVYMVLRIPDRGVIVKLAGKITPDQKTGQLTTTFDDIPQLPVASFKLHFREGARSPLVTPPLCGTYSSTAAFISWAAPKESTVLHPAFEISTGVNGGPCPQHIAPFSPGFVAGAINDDAGSYTPGYLRLTRGDGEQDLTKFSATFPPGLVAKLAGVSRCPDTAIELAKTRMGREERSNPSCPSSSEIGNVFGGVGVGSVLTYSSGKIYLAGPFHGDPLSVVAIVPAVAGPFDAGTVVTRQALSLDPSTGKVQVDGSRSDPLPHILAGIPLKVRDIRVHIDRPEFVLNPTNCNPSAFSAQLWGGGLDVFSPEDDFALIVSSRFQTANCARLGFKPKLLLRLFGGTRRGSHPALRAVFKPRKGDANLGAARVILPRSAFIEQSHFRTICTRVQYAQRQCPSGSIYGHVKAFSPLLDEPLEGPVYLRSSTHTLPDLVLALHGVVDVDVVASVDSVHGRLRSTFASTPDVPASKVILTMQGGKKGLFVNSTNLCRGRQRAKAFFTGQNGKTHYFNPVVRNSCDKGREGGRQQDR